MTKRDAIAKALDAGATMDEIEAEAAIQARHVGTVPFRNMIKALTLPVSRFLNDKADWTRLAAALIAKGRARRR